MLKRTEAVPTSQRAAAAAQLVRRIFTALKPDEKTDVARAEPASFAYWMPPLPLPVKEEDSKG